MAVQPAATLSAIPEFPALSDRAAGTYNSKAYTFGTHMGSPGPFVSEINALAANVKNNADEAATEAGLAMGYRNSAGASATSASASAGTATTQAGNASTSASQAEASRIEASKLNLGAKAAPPTVDNQGQALRTGATYYDTTLNKLRAWNGSAWVDPVNVTAGVTSVNSESGNVTLDAAKVGALPATGAISVGGSVRAPRVAVAALAIDCSAGNYFAKTINANSTLTFTGAPAAGNAYGMSIDITHTSGVITWPTSVKWPGDAAPSLTTGKVHKFLFTTSDGGTTWRGAALSNYAS